MTISSKNLSEVPFPHLWNGAKVLQPLFTASRVQREAPHHDAGTFHLNNSMLFSYFWGMPALPSIHHEHSLIRYVPGVLQGTNPKHSHADHWQQLTFQFLLFAQQVKQVPPQSWRMASEERDAQCQLCRLSSGCARPPAAVPRALLTWYSRLRA